MFSFGVLQAVHAYIQSVKLQRLESQTQRDILYKNKRSSHAFLKGLIQTRPHRSTSLCGKICITPPKCIRKERRRNTYSAVVLLQPPCCGDAVFRWERETTLFGLLNENTTRNQLSYICNTVSEQYNAIFECVQRILQWTIS